MQVTETKSEGLKREYEITVTAADLDAKTTEKLETLRKDVHMKGFRKGKVPLALMKQRFGKSVLGEVVQETVEQTVTPITDKSNEVTHFVAIHEDITARIESDGNPARSSPITLTLRTRAGCPSRIM